MRMLSPSLRGVSTAGRIAYWLGLAFLVFLIVLTLLFTSLTTTIFAVLLMILYMVSAPFVFGGKWRAPRPAPTRRPVVRRRRY
ncbi:MAG: hypothetical protein M3Y37_00730 [Chloroflexota bacterium]|nr:hypothetical protein [Chloroflexota bacterium]